MSKSSESQSSESAPDGRESGDAAGGDVKAAFKAALERKHAKNSHPENHLDGHTVGTGNNDTHKRQFRRKSG